MNEIWKDIKGYEGRYQVSNKGRIKSLERTDRNGHHRPERILKTNKRPNGYLCVHLSKDMDAKWLSVHRLVAEAFIPHDNDKDVVNHLDNNPLNNNVNNLEWTTYKGNMQWSSKQGRMKPNYANLQKAQESRKIPVVAISKTGVQMVFESQSEAGKALNVNRAHIAAACRKEYGYKSVGGYTFEYADDERNEKATPQKVGMTKEEMKMFLSDRMKGNTIMKGRHLSDETKRKLAEATGRKVTQFTRDGVKVAEYLSSNEAKKITGIAHIHDAANGKRKTAGKYVWKWSDDL